MNYSEFEENIIKKEYPKNGVVGVQKFIKRTHDSIRHKARAIGVTRVSNFHWSKKDFSYLINVKKAKYAYLLGIIWGDGHISWNKKNRNYTISLTLLEKDLNEILDLLIGFRLINVPKQKESWKQCSRAYVSHKILANYLKNNDFCIKSIASPTKILNRIPKKFHHMFFRGWFDADGSNNEIIKSKYVLIIAGNYKQNWLDFERLLKKLKILYKIRRVKRPNGQKYSTLTINRYNQIIKFRNYLYRTNKNIGLSRKRNNFYNISSPIHPNKLK